MVNGLEILPRFPYFLQFLVSTDVDLLCKQHMHHFSIITTSSSSSSSAEADGGSIATATGTGASPPLIVSTYSVSGSCFVAGNAWCIANSFVPQHDCFCLRHRPFVCPFVECSDRLHLVQCCFIIHNFLIRFLTLLQLCSAFLLVQCFRSQFKASSRYKKFLRLPIAPIPSVSEPSDRE